VRQEKSKNVATVAVEQCRKLTPLSPPLFSRREGGTKENRLPRPVQGGEFGIGSEEISCFVPVVTIAGSFLNGAPENRRISTLHPLYPKEILHPASSGIQNVY